MQLIEAAILDRKSGEAEGSAVPRTSPGNAEYDAQTELSSRLSGPNDKGVGWGRACPLKPKAGLNGPPQTLVLVQRYLSPLFQPPTRFIAGDDNSL
jgi:hypothetical protein